MNSEGMIMWSPGTTLDDVEKQVILKAFRHFRGNKTTTANALGIAIRTLDHKLEKYRQESDNEETANAKYRDDRHAFLARQRGTIQRNQETGADVFGTTTGLQMESSSQAQSELEMPMPKRPQVQTVLPGQASKSGSGKNR